VVDFNGDRRARWLPVCVTFNVLGPANPDWERRSRVIGRALRALEADVVALQEVNVRGGVEDLLGPDYCITPFSATSEDDTGAALATRAKHRVLEEIDQRTAEHGEDLPWCATLIVELESSVGPLVIAHHKPNWPFPLEVEREQQARRAALAVEEHAGDQARGCPRRFRRRPGVGEHAFLAGPAIHRRRERLLSRRVGDGAAHGPRIDVHSGEPAGACG
jgi:hypothetical protein